LELRGNPEDLTFKKADLSVCGAIVAPPGESLPEESGTIIPATVTDVEFVGHIGGPAYAVAARGDYAYIGQGQRLTILDVSNPASSTVVGQTDPLCGYGADVAAAGGYAYVTAGDAGLRVVDVSNPSHPTQVGCYDTPGDAKSVAVAGRYAYVAAKQTGLRVVDVSNPANPTEVGFCATPGEDWDVPYAVAVAGAYAYVADSNVGLWVVDVSDPANPTEVGLYNTPESAEDAALAGSYAYITDYEAGLWLVRGDRMPDAPPTCPTVIGGGGLFVEGATDGEATAVENVSVDHCGFDVFVTQEFLDGADVVAVLQQVGGERVAEGVAGNAPGDAGPAGGSLDGLLQAVGVEVGAAEHACARVGGESVGRKDVLPGPFSAGVRVFAFQGEGEFDAAVALAQVVLVYLFDAAEVFLERGDDGAGQQGDAVFHAFAVADGDLNAGKVNVFDAQGEALVQAEAATVEQLGHQFVSPGQESDEAAGFYYGQDDGQADGFLGADGVDRPQVFFEPLAVQE